MRRSRRWVSRSRAAAEGTGAQDPAETDDGRDDLLHTPLRVGQLQPIEGRRLIAYGAGIADIDLMRLNFAPPRRPLEDGSACRALQVHGAVVGHHETFGALPPHHEEGEIHVSQVHI